MLAPDPTTSSQGFLLLPPPMIGFKEQELSYPCDNCPPHPCKPCVLLLAACGTLLCHLFFRPSASSCFLTTSRPA